jgi:hypothetical protein
VKISFAIVCLSCQLVACGVDYVDYALESCSAGTETDWTGLAEPPAQAEALLLASGKKSSLCDTPEFDMDAWFAGSERKFLYCQFAETSDGEICIETWQFDVLPDSVVVLRSSRKISEK